MNSRDLLDFVLERVDPGSSPPQTKSLDLVTLRGALHYAHINGVLHPILHSSEELTQLADKEIRQLLALDEQEWGALQHTLQFLERIRVEEGIDYMVIKWCNKVPHLPRDVDVFVHREERERILDVFQKRGYTIAYANSLETAFIQPDYLKLDIYCQIQYLGTNFLDNDYLWQSVSSDSVAGISFRTLNDEANFLLLLVHSLFGHRMMTLLDFLQLKELRKTVDIDRCRNYANEKGWGQVFETMLHILFHLQEQVYRGTDPVDFPYLYDRNLVVQAIHSLTTEPLGYRQKLVLHVSFLFDTLTYHLIKSPVFSLFKKSRIGRTLYNSLVHFIRNRRGDQHGMERGKTSPKTPR